MSDAVVVVGSDGRIVLTNPAYDRAFNNGELVLADEVGRSQAPADLVGQH
jgi:hypothetical protein